MNREIKFRGISVESNNFIYGVPIISGIHAFIITIKNRACDLGSRVKPETVGQYTGSKDMNGVEIYEGDILQSEHYFRYQVVFKGDCWRCEPLKNKGFKNRFIGRDLKVIGNIYQNNDLLEVE